ncbi:MAG: HD domain-containing protein [Deltaproteobacteria bacterium]|jgi:putative hydrolase of HD superfamily|nr:HD domain-containing protein [Deltaproteobacteria bacterium]
MDLIRILDFLFEAESLKRTPRTGYQFLGRGRETVAEHSFGAVLWSFVLGRLVSDRPVDMEKLLKLALFHDLPETRTGDLNYVNKRYVTSHEDAAYEAATAGLPFRDELADLRREWAERRTLEALLAYDADQLDMMLELRRLAGHGWQPARDWLFYAEKRLLTEEGRRLAGELVRADPDHWWFEKREELWINPRPPEGD